MGFVTRVTQWVPLVEPELLTLHRAPELIPGFSGVRVAQSVVFCVDHFMTFFHLAIVLSVLRLTDSGYPFGILKLFLIESVLLNICSLVKCFGHIFVLLY
jgi:hypothetical protein